MDIRDPPPPPAMSEANFREPLPSYSCAGGVVLFACVRRGLCVPLPQARCFRTKRHMLGMRQGSWSVNPDAVRGKSPEANITPKNHLEERLLDQA